MTPSIPSRIDSLIQAMSDIILPALDADKSLAHEQAQLVIGHLHLMKRQLARADAFDRSELADAVRLAQQSLELTADDTGVVKERTSLRAALNEAERLPELQDAIRVVNGAIENFVRALRLQAGRHSIDTVTSAVLAHAREKSQRNRIWFASNGFDAERDSLPGIETLFPGETAQGQKSRTPELFSCSIGPSTA